MERVLITGSNGLVGSNLAMELAKRKSIGLYLTSFGENRLSNYCNSPFFQCDISDHQKVNELVDNVKPDVIFHCAALSQVDYCEKNKEECLNVNVQGTKYLLKAASRYKSHFLFYSTDFVLDGKQDEYTEESHREPVNFYGSSKVEAEKSVVTYPYTYKIIRPILIYGQSPSVARGNFVKWVKTSLENNQSIKVVTDQFRQPTPLHHLIGASIQLKDVPTSEILNIAGRDRISVFRFANRIAEYYGLDKSLIEPVNASTFKEVGKRPFKTSFNLGKIQSLINYNPPSIEEGLSKF